MSYKSRHEEFVSGLSGGSIAEVYAVSGLLVLAYFVWWLVSRRLAGPSAWITDFFFNWLVPLLAITVYSGRLIYLAGIIVLPLIFAGTSAGSRSSSAPEVTYLAPKPFITVYRASMLILTAIAILAVDFKVFPRRFAKAETWGASLMDLGVGSFVFSMGVVSARPILKEALDDTKRSTVIERTSKALKQSAKLLVLALVRLAAVKKLGYQEHESEYGVHWNFFMTLGLLPPFTALFQSLVYRIPLVVLGVGVAVGYELALKNTGLQEWVLAAPRTTLISANKEGISSFFGFLAIFLIGQSVGLYVLPMNLPKNGSSLFPPTREKLMVPLKSTPTRIIILLFASSVIFHGLFTLFRSETEVSRRLANLPYVLWIASYNTGCLGAYALGSLLLRSEPSQTQLAVNSHGQSMFLLANLATGVVNILLPTIDMSLAASMATLVVYLMALCAGSLVLARWF